MPPMHAGWPGLASAIRVITDIRKNARGMAATSG
jgi:hypothetical protein